MQERKLITAAEMDRMTPQQRADAVLAATCRTWDDVPEPFRSKFLAETDELAKRLERRD